MQSIHNYLLTCGVKGDNAWQAGKLVPIHQVAQTIGSTEDGNGALWMKWEREKGKGTMNDKSVCIYAEERVTMTTIKTKTNEVLTANRGAVGRPVVTCVNMQRFSMKNKERELGPTHTYTLTFDRSSLRYHRRMGLVAVCPRGPSRCRPGVGHWPVVYDVTKRKIKKKIKKYECLKRDHRHLSCTVSHLCSYRFPEIAVKKWCLGWVRSPVEHQADLEVGPLLAVVAGQINPQRATQGMPANGDVLHLRMTG